MKVFTPGQMSGINMLVDNGTSVFLDDQCTRLLLYPDQMCVLNNI
jgi:hypothetical protein